MPKIEMFEFTSEVLAVGVDATLWHWLLTFGSQEAALSLYHPGGYLTWPPSENVMEWLFTDEEGNVVHEETLIDENFVSFGHDVPITDTLFVSVLLTNDSSIYYDGNPVACLIEDYLTLGRDGNYPRHIHRKLDAWWCAGNLCRRAIQYWRSGHGIPINRQKAGFHCRHHGSRGKPVLHQRLGTESVAVFHLRRRIC